VEAADELRIGLGQLPEGAVQEVDPYPTGLVAAHELRFDRVEPEAVELGHQGGQAPPPALAPAGGVGSPAPPEVGGVEPVAAELLGQGRQKAGQESVGRRVEPEPGRTRGE
jgi:hypothetical protein